MDKRGLTRSPRTLRMQTAFRIDSSGLANDKSDLESAKFNGKRPPTAKKTVFSVLGLGIKVGCCWIESWIYRHQHKFTCCDSFSEEIILASWVQSATSHPDQLFDSELTYFRRLIKTNAPNLSFTNLSCTLAHIHLLPCLDLLPTLSLAIHFTLRLCRETSLKRSTAATNYALGTSTRHRSRRARNGGHLLFWLGR